MHFAEDLETFDEWLEKLRDGKEVYPRHMIPYEEWKQTYIDSIKEKSHKEVKGLLRLLLFPYTRQMDIEAYQNLNNKLMLEEIKKLSESAQNEWKNNLERTADLELYHRIENGQEAWEGLTWVLQLLPYHPYKAVKALGNYLDAEMGSISDERIIGLNQCMEIIEAKYIYGNLDKGAILSLKWREFEYLIELLYQDLGYDTILTPATRDGGKDVIAKIKREDGIEEVYIECKLYKTTELKPNHIRILRDVINENKATRGVIFCTGHASEELKQMDKRIQIWTIDDINFLLNAHMGTDWVERLPLLLDNQRRKYVKVK